MFVERGARLWQVSRSEPVDLSATFCSAVHNPCEDWYKTSKVVDKPGSEQSSVVLVGCLKWRVASMLHCKAIRSPVGMT